MIYSERGVRCFYVATLVSAWLKPSASSVDFGRDASPCLPMSVANHVIPVVSRPDQQ